MATARRSGGKGYKMIITLQVGNSGNVNYFSNLDGKGRHRAMGFIMGLRQMTDKEIFVEDLVDGEGHKRAELTWAVRERAGNKCPRQDLAMKLSEEDMIQTKAEGLITQLLRMLDEGMDSVSFDALSDWHEDHGEGPRPGARHADATIRDLLLEIKRETTAWEGEIVSQYQAE